jgi:hypothetical protein
MAAGEGGQGMGRLRGGKCARTSSGKCARGADVMPGCDESFSLRAFHDTVKRMASRSRGDGGAAEVAAAAPGPAVRDAGGRDGDTRQRPTRWAPASSGTTMSHRPATSTSGRRGARASSTLCSPTSPRPDRRTPTRPSRGTRGTSPVSVYSRDKSPCGPTYDRTLDSDSSAPPGPHSWRDRARAPRAGVAIRFHRRIRR